jgi:hypothetical protein
MDTLTKLFDDITSWYWWFSVVLVGFGINLASAYVKPSLDGWYANRSEKKRLSSAIERAEFDQRVELLAANPLLLVLEAHEELRERTRFLFFFFAGVFLNAAALGALRMSTTYELLAFALAVVSTSIAIYAYVQANSLLKSTANRAQAINAAKKALLSRIVGVVQPINPQDAAR